MFMDVEKKVAATSLLDELEKGDWPSFVTEIKKAAKTTRFSLRLTVMLVIDLV